MTKFLPSAYHDNMIIGSLSLSPYQQMQNGITGNTV